MKTRSGLSKIVEMKTGNEVFKFKGGDYGPGSFSSDGRYYCYYVRNEWPRRSAGATGMIETKTGKEIYRMPLHAGVRLVEFSPNVRYVVLVCDDNTARVLPLEWLETNEECTYHWRSALQFLSGNQFKSDGSLVRLSTKEMLSALHELDDFISAKPMPNESWQYAILKWIRMLPDVRTTTPWTEEPIRVVVGRTLMKSGLHSSITRCADQAPWHPLVPVSLARPEPKSFVEISSSPSLAIEHPKERSAERPLKKVEITPNVRPPSAPIGLRVENVVDAYPADPAVVVAKRTAKVNPRFLARLTLKRLRDADEKLYSRETLAEYAAWSAKIMHEELHLDPEALEAITFALERTPKDKQQPILDLKQKLMASAQPDPSGDAKPISPEPAPHRDQARERIPVDKQPPIID
jgi:hypothetical protein